MEEKQVVSSEPFSQSSNLASEPRKGIKYQLTRWDLMCWQFYSTTHNRVLMSIFPILALWLIWTTPDLVGETLAAKVFGFVVVTAFLAFFSFVLWGVVTSITTLSGKFRGLLGAHELEFREDGLVERSEINESLYRWAGFGKIVTMSRHLLIYVSDSYVIIVPRRCFASEDEMRIFRGELGKRCDLARSDAGGRG